ncbi:MULTISPECIES: four helix bundle protein [unclassified Pseudoalteromonas]|uniref:four helix bundle protein n=1 Tax=Pseudoalteromonas TaxID=53246 RepID=UPI0015D52FCE|nr:MULTISPECIES: four helix bundle protein [unclassified Pseudoalteromonas]QLJ07975.1 four helix bundle protein [Pseudoalteromonas sp. JSTW]
MYYENLDVWKRSFKLSLLVYKSLYALKDYGLKDQMCRCSVSIPSNIAEGYERFSQKERAHFLSIAKGSVGELKTQIMLASELGYLQEDSYLFILNECEEIGKMLGKLIYIIKNN